MTDLATVIRPNGKVYRPRKPPRAVEVDNTEGRWDEPTMLVYVLGTHDVERAHALALKLHHAADKDTAQLSWTRDVIRNHERVFEYDAEHGAATVIFGVIE